MEKEIRRKIPFKNYIILFAIFIITVVITVYVNAWIKTYKNNQALDPLDNVVQKITLNDLEATMSETNIAILYVANINDYEMNDAILKIVNKNELNDNFYYMNVEDNSDSNTISILKKYFSNLEGDINKLPMFIYIKNGKAEKIIDSNETNLTANDLYILIDSYWNEN